jgi:hypothetical protein
MSREQYIQFPAKIRPRLPGGSIHKMRVDDNRTEIATWPGLYGNEESKLLLAIPHPSLIAAEYARPLLQVGTGYCKVRYVDESGKENSLKFNVVDPDLSGEYRQAVQQNRYTEAVAKTLVDLKQGKSGLPPYPATLTFTPPSSKKKFLYVLALFGPLMIIGGLVLGSDFALLGGVLIFPPALAALGIDYVRLHTGWHPVVKVGASILIFLLMFIGFGIAVTLCQVLGLL